MDTRAPSVPGNGATIHRLTQAAITLWETDGAAAMSARAIARAADIPVSSIYHHFGDIDGLLASAGETARAAAMRWCAEQLDALAGTTADPASFAPILATLIDDWCERQRPLAFAWREAQLLAMRDPARRAGAAAWSALWAEFWGSLCDRLGLTDHLPELMLLFDGESSMHLLRWRRPIDRAALNELCATWARWCDGHTDGPAYWRSLARNAAIAGQPPEPTWTDATEGIAAAAATTVARRGLHGLTHRAVADEAGMTLGVVSNRFRSSADLLRAAFESMYRRMVAPLGGDDTPIPIDLIGRTDHGTDDGLLRGWYELSLAATRDPAFHPFTAQLRYLRGRTSIRYLRAVVRPERRLSITDAALASSLLSAWTRAGLSGEARDSAFPARLFDRLRDPAPRGE